MIGGLLALLLAAAPAPAAVAWILQLHSPSAGDCHGTPVSPVAILTAAHCVGVDGIVKWKGQDREGLAVAVWREDVPRDLAILITGSSNGWRVVPIGKTPPNNLADLWWRLYLPQLRSVAATGYALGTDDTGDLDFFGPAEPGSSGSGLINDEGELVGVVTRTFNPYLILTRPGNERQDRSALTESVKVLALSCATPVNAWPEPR